MSALALPRPTTLIRLFAATGVALATLAACYRIGPPGLALPLLLAVLAGLLNHPSWALGAFAGSLLLAEHHSGNLIPGLQYVYATARGGLTPVDALLALAITSLALDLSRRREPPRLARPLQLAGLVLLVAFALGLLVGHFNGSGLYPALLEGRSLPYLLLVPLLTANLVRTTADARRLAWLLGAAVLVKSVLGLLALAAGRSIAVEGAVITYYEPAANFLAMLFLTSVLAARLARVHIPLWAYAGLPLVIACLTLSFRRSFWIGTILGLLIVTVLGLSAVQRRLAIPVGLLVASAIYLVLTTGFQTSGPLVERAQSLKPSRVTASAEDRYRLDERANVVGEIRRHPLLGLGLHIPWHAADRGLPVNHSNGRGYVHTTLLWFWLKLGVLGALAYVGTMWAWGLLAWRVWRGSRTAALRAFGLSSLATLAGMLAVESTGSFTGVDDRFTAMLGVVIGLISALPQLREAE